MTLMLRQMENILQTTPGITPSRQPSWLEVPKTTLESYQEARIMQQMQPIVGVQQLTHQLQYSTVTQNVISTQETHQMTQIMQQLQQITQGQQSTQLKAFQEVSSTRETDEMAQLIQQLQEVLQTENSNQVELDNVNVIIMRLKQELKKQPSSALEYELMFEIMEDLQQLLITEPNILISELEQLNNTLLMLLEVVQDQPVLNVSEKREPVLTHKITESEHLATPEKEVYKLSAMPDAKRWQLKRSGDESVDEPFRRKKRIVEDLNDEPSHGYGKDLHDRSHGHGKDRKDWSSSDHLAVMKDKEEDMVRNDGDVLKHMTLQYCSRDIRITLIPPGLNSLYASLAYLLLGPFRSHAMLSSATTSLHQQGIRYMLENRDLFFNLLNKLYNELFPDHRLDPLTAFEECCHYLAQPGHKGMYESVLAVSTMYNTPVHILYEENSTTVKVDPIHLCVAKPPISILRRVGHNNFDPIDEFFAQSPSIKNLTVHVSPQRMFSAPTSFPINNNHLHNFSNHKVHSLSVATWSVRGTTIERILKLIDESLNNFDIDLAILQDPSALPGHKIATNYEWTSTVFSEQFAVIFLLNKRSQCVLSKFCAHSNRLASAEVSFHGTKFFVIGCSLSGFKNKRFPRDSTDLMRLILQAPTSSQILLIVNSTAQIGGNNSKKLDSNVVGKNPTSEDKSEDKVGIFLKSLAIKHNLRVISSFPTEVTTHDTHDVDETGTAKFTEDSFKFKHSYILLQHIPFKKTSAFFRWVDNCNNALVASNIEVPAF